MAFDPASYNLISLNGLTSAFSPNGDWILAIQDPSGETITSIRADDLRVLLNGDLAIPDGVLNGIDQTVNNLTTPKVLSVSAGQWRTNNVPYTSNASVNFNIPTADGSLDRIDRVYLDTTGVNYQVGTAGAGVPAIPSGSIGLVPFTVPAGGGDITEPSPTLSAIYAVMNLLNNGDFDITGDFKKNGVPISSGSSLISIELFGDTGTWTDLGDGLWSAPLPTLEDDKTYSTLMKIYPDQTDLATYYFKVPEPESGNLINIEWDGVSDIKILLKKG